MGSSGAERRSAWLTAGAIGLAWLALQGVLLATLGLRRGGDSGRYLSAAGDLLSGALPAGKSLSYLGYDAFVAVFLALGLGPASIVCAQMALSGVAGWCLFRVGETALDARAGLLAAALYLLYPPLQMWNVYLLTESLFVSSVVISMCLLIRARGAWGYLAALTAVVFATLVRPHGVVVPVAALAFVIARLWSDGRRAAAWSVAGAAACAAPIAYAAIGHMLAFEKPLSHFLSGTVIWGADAPRLQPPTGAAETTEPGNPIAQTLSFAAQHPVYFAQLAGAKLFWFFARARPYYSTLHNAFIAVTLVPLYLFALRGVFVRLRRPPVRWLLLSLWLLPAAVVALTFADWDSRHSLVTLPAVFVLAAVGASSLAASWKR